MRKRVIGLTFAALFLISSLAAVPASAEAVEWSEPLEIGSEGFESSDPSIATNDQGRQIVAWSGWDGTQYSVYANRFAPETGWSGAENIGTGYYYVDAGIDDAGNSIVVWTVDAMVLARTYVEENGAWDELTVISDSGRNPFSIRVSVSGNGGAAAIWMDWGDDLKLGVYASIRDPDTSWGPAEQIQSHPNGKVYYPSVAMDDDMNAFGVYLMLDDVQWNVYAIRYTDGVGWGSGIVIGSQSHVSYQCRPALAMNGDGLAIAAWQSVQDSRYVASANIYDPESGMWGGETLIEDSTTGSSILADADVDENGEAVVAWRLESSDETPDSIRANLYDPVSGWSGPATIGEAVGPISGVPVDLDTCAVTGGRSYVAWSDGTFAYPYGWSVYANHHNRVDGWVGTSVITEAVNVSRISITTNHLGGATVAWAGWYDTMQWYDWGVYVSSCADPGPTGEDPVAVMDIREKSSWKTYKFDGRASTDDVGVVAYLWDFGDGTYADNKVACHSYQKAGDYTVTLTVWDDDGNHDSTSVTLTVRPAN